MEMQWIFTLGNDVMVEFPKRGYKISKSGNYVTVSITNDPAKEGYVYYPFSRLAQGDKNYFYIGAYKMNGNYSSSGKAPGVSGGRATFRSGVLYRGTGYSLTGFYQYVYLQCLFLLKYKSRDSQSALGNGYVGGTGVQNTGVTNTNGLDYGSTSNLTTRVKCFGIEDLWGNVFEWMDGILVNGSYKVVATYIPSNFNDTGANHSELFTLVGMVS